MCQPYELGRTVSRFLFYSAIYLLDLPPGKERAALLSLRTLRYTWSFWPWCRHHYMSPYNVVSSCLAVSPLPFGGLFSVTAFIRLLPSVLSTAGCPFQSGLSSGAHQRKIFTPSRLAATAPRGMRSSRSSDRRPIVLSSSSKTRTRSRRLVPSWDTNNLCA